MARYRSGKKRSRHTDHACSVTAAQDRDRGPSISPACMHAYRRAGVSSTPPVHRAAWAGGVIAAFTVAAALLPRNKESGKEAWGREQGRG